MFAEIPEDMSVIPDGDYDHLLVDACVPVAPAPHLLCPLFVCICVALVLGRLCLSLPLSCAQKSGLTVALARVL